MEFDVNFLSPVSGLKQTTRINTIEDLDEDANMGCDDSGPLNKWGKSAVSLSGPQGLKLLRQGQASQSRGQKGQNQALRGGQGQDVGDRDGGQGRASGTKRSPSRSRIPSSSNTRSEKKEGKKSASTEEFRKRCEAAGIFLVSSNLQTKNGKITKAFYKNLLDAALYAQDESQQQGKKPKQRRQALKAGRGDTDTAGGKRKSGVGKVAGKKKKKKKVKKRGKKKKKSTKRYRVTDINTILRGAMKHNKM